MRSLFIMQLILLMSECAMGGFTFISGTAVVIFFSFKINIIDFTGDDSDDIDHCETAAACNGLIVTVFDYALSLSQLTGTVRDVLAIGVNGDQAFNALTNWQTGQGFTMDIITSENDIDSVTFTDYKLIYLPSSAAHCLGGISCYQLDLLANRSSDIINFINVHKGSLIALTHDGCSGAYNFLAATLGLTSISIDQLDITTRLTTIAPLLTTNSLDHCCYHTAYTGPEGYGGLQVLATDPANGD